MLLDRPLVGRAEFLFARVPAGNRDIGYRLVPESGPRSVEATLHAVGALYQAGVTLVFDGYPSISPLIGYLCVHGQIPERAESAGAARMERESTSLRVVLWRSEAFRDSWAEPSKRLAAMPGGTVRWTPANDGERFDHAIVGSP